MRQVARLIFLAGTLFVAACSTAHYQASTKETKIVVLAPAQADAELKKYAADAPVSDRCIGRK